MKKLGLASLVLAAACSGQPASTQGALSADPTARSFGIASYAVEGDTVRMLDEYGLELGTLTVRDAADRRLIDVALADGTTDEVEVYRPMSDGRFQAPIARDFTAGAALADAALAPLLATHAIRFRVAGTSQVAAGITPSMVATTTSCTSPSSDTPDGCARPANTAVGCTNPSQLPATMVNYGSYETEYLGYPEYSSRSVCNGNAQADCAAALWGTASDWLAYGCYTDGYGSWWPHCTWYSTSNQWTASCPASTCTTAGQYDAVPRNRACADPGSCSKSQGTVACTPYH